MSKGWISLHRQIWDNEYLWNDRPFSRGQAWIDLLMFVNHKDNETIIDKQPFIVKRGQKITSLRQLGNRWGWKKDKVADFLNSLVSLRMIKKIPDTKKTVITIVNYSLYQDVGEKTRHRADTEQTPSRTNNNDNNNNNLFSCRNSPNGVVDDDKKSEFWEKAFKSAQYIAKQIERSKPNHPQIQPKKKDKSIHQWAVDIEKLLRIDKVDFEEFKRVLYFSQNDEFWRKNILSGKKLREQYGNLLMKLPEAEHES